MTGNPSPARRWSGGVVAWTLGLAVTVALAAGVSSFASEAPDGLERVAVDHGVAEAAVDHPLAGSPLADYETDGVADRRWSTALAGMAGVAGTLAGAGGLLWLLRRHRPGQGRPMHGAGPSTTGPDGR